MFSPAFQCTRTRPRPIPGQVQSPAIEARVAQIEAVAQRDVGRNVAPLAAAARGGLLRAAASLAAEPAPRVVVVTGCFIAHAVPPAAETDGPPGAALLAAALHALEIPAKLLTDRLCEPVVRAAASAIGPTIDVDVAGDDPSEVDGLAHAYARERVTHVVYVERLGPGPDGRVLSMKGQDLTTTTAPLHRLAGESRWRTVGIGDGGNEVGMGSLPPELIATAVRGGEKIRCVVPCDALVVAGVSNWGAAGLALATGLVRAPDRLDEVLDAIAQHRYDASLAAMLDCGAVDGVAGVPAPSVDGVDAETNGAVLDALRTAAGPGGS